MKTTKLRKSDVSALRREAVQMLIIAPMAAKAEDWKSCSAITSSAVVAMEFADAGASATLSVADAVARWRKLAPRYRESKIATFDWAHQHHRSHAYVASLLAGYAPSAPFVRQRSIDASRYTEELGRRLRGDVAAAIKVAETLRSVGEESRSHVSVRCPHTRRVRADLMGVGVIDASWDKSTRTWTLDPRSIVKLRSCTEEQVDTFVYVLCRRGWQATKHGE